MASPYRTDSNIILKYKSNRAFLLKKELLVRRISLFTTFFLQICKVMWTGKPVIDGNAQKTSVFHPLDPFLSNTTVVTEFSGPMCGFLINSIPLIAYQAREWINTEIMRNGFEILV